MTGPVVAGVDGGPRATDALHLAAWAAATLGAPLIVAVVHPAPAALGSGRVDAEWTADRRRAAVAVLDGARAVLADLAAASLPGGAASSPDAAASLPGGAATSPDAAASAAAFTGPAAAFAASASGTAAAAPGEAVAASAGVHGGVEYRAVASSSAAHGLHDLAEAESAALIVVGSGRAAPRQRTLAGSTASRLLAGSVCPVAVAPAELATPVGGIGRIGVAYVDTPDGRAALDQAARLARRTGAAVRLYTVVSDADAALPFLIGDDAERAFLDTARETYERALTAAAASVTGVAADWRIAAGDVVRTLADLDEIDVLFCGSRGYGPARRVLLGGVSTRLVHRARRPVVVVPRSG